MTDLMDAVDALTKPSRTKIPQGDQWTTIHHDPLLVQLEDAVTSAIGNGGGGGSATGAVINDAALSQLLQIKSQITGWCHQFGATPDRKNVSVSLSRWLVAFMGSNRNPAGPTRMLQDWAATIQELLDPPKTVPLKGACPVCSATSWEGPDGAYRASPVAVLYDQSVLHASLRAVCRVVACGAEWVGADAVQELVEEMTEREEA